MMKLVVVSMVVALSACSAGPGTSEDVRDGDFEDVDGVDPDSSDDTPEDSDGDTDSATGGSGSNNTGGTSNDNTGGTDSGTGGTGGTEPADEGCFPQWDPTKVYVYPETVQVGERIFRSCASDEEEGAAVIGEEPKNHFGGWSPTCEYGWSWESNCPSTKCEDAIVWDTEANTDFWPPVMAGTLFLFEGQVWELEQDDVFWLGSAICAPNATEPSAQCTGQDGNLSFHLAEQCL